MLGFGHLTLLTRGNSDAEGLPSRNTGRLGQGYKYRLNISALAGFGLHQPVDFPGPAAFHLGVAPHIIDNPIINGPGPSKNRGFISDNLDNLVPKPAFVYPERGKI